MPRKKSGNALWEPVALKLPKEMIAELRRFADLHGMNMSEVLREGMLMRMSQEGVTKGYDHSYTFTSATSEDAMALASVPAVATQLRHLAAVLEQVACVRPQQVLPSQGALTTGIGRLLSDVHTTFVPAPPDRPEAAPADHEATAMDASPQEEPSPALDTDPLSAQLLPHGYTVIPQLPAIPTVDPCAEGRASPTDLPPFDPTKYVLGTLCHGPHDYQGTGKTLRTLHGNKCPKCKTERQRERRVAARRAGTALAG